MSKLGCNGHERLSHCHEQRTDATGFQYVCSQSTQRHTWLCQEKLNKLEAELGEHRGSMALGYKEPAGGAFRKVSSVQLSNTMKTSEDEATRKVCWEVAPTSPPAKSGGLALLSAFHLYLEVCGVLKTDRGRTECQARQVNILFRPAFP